MTMMREEVATLLAQAHEVPLLDQGAIQFILMGVMILAVLFVLWITIAK
jgi:hypothetical protein